MALEDMNPNRRVVVALGSNLGDSRANLLAAIERLRELGDKLVASSLVISKPVDCPPGSPDFVNAVVAFGARVGETPESLLEKLQALEVEFGRRPKVVMNEPRSLDLDIILFGRERRDSEKLTIPHPRAHLREFVLGPMREIGVELPE